MAEFHNESLAIATTKERYPEFVERLRSGRAVLFRPTTMTSEPLVRKGTIVMVDPLVRPPLPGEVVLAFVAGLGHATLHRVLRVQTNLVWVWSEAAETARQNIEHDAVAREILKRPFQIHELVGIARIPSLDALATFRLKLRRLWRSLEQRLGARHL